MLSQAISATLLALLQITSALSVPRAGVQSNNFTITATTLLTNTTLGHLTSRSCNTTQQTLPIFSTLNTSAPLAAYTTYQPYPAYSQLLFPAQALGLRVLAVLPDAPLRQATLVAQEGGSPSMGWYVDEAAGELKHAAASPSEVRSVLLSCGVDSAGEGRWEGLYLGAEGVALPGACREVRLGVEFV